MLFILIVQDLVQRVSKTVIDYKSVVYIISDCIMYILSKFIILVVDIVTVRIFFYQLFACRGDLIHLICNSLQFSIIYIDLIAITIYSARKNSRPLAIF